MGQDEGLPERLSVEIEAHFPNLVESGYFVTSAHSELYNCIAYAAGDETKKWDCGMLPVPGYYWPPGAKRGKYVDALISAFESIGFEQCTNGDLESGYQKVVLYADADGAWTHAAKQLPDGAWSSKIGSCEDIRHLTPYALCSCDYGSVWHYMRRMEHDEEAETES